MRAAPPLLLGLLPVVLFLAALLLMDSFKLVSRSAVARSIAWGALAAMLSFAVNAVLLRSGVVSAGTLRRLLAPAFEELIKAAGVAWLVRRAAVGFLVDAGIHGFAVGTGFALVENVYYAAALQTADPVLWLARGLGTAVMHGSTTAVYAIVTKDLIDRRESHAPVLYAVGLVFAWAAHSAFNHLLLPPLVQAAVLLVVMPLALFLVFERGERATRDWLGQGMDREIELHALLVSGEVHTSRMGRYLESLGAHFPPHVVADMLCYLRIHAELALSAKGILLARSTGVHIAVDEGVRANFREMEFLERSIGATGRMALTPFLQQSSRDLWQLHMLGGPPARRP